MKLNYLHLSKLIFLNMYQAICSDAVGTVQPWLADAERGRLGQPDHRASPGTTRNPSQPSLPSFPSFSAFLPLSLPPLHQQANPSSCDPNQILQTASHPAGRALRHAGKGISPPSSPPFSADTQKRRVFPLFISSQFVFLTLVLNAHLDARAEVNGWGIEREGDQTTAAHE